MLESTIKAEKNPSRAFTRRHAADVASPPCGLIAAIRTLLFLIGFACSLLLSFAAISAEPLFEYAKTRVLPAPYLLTIVRGKTVSKNLRSAMRLLRKAERDGIIILKEVSPDSRHQRWKIPERLKRPLPYCILWRGTRGAPTPVTAIPLSPDSVKTLLSSPARERMVEALARGANAVFLLLDGPDSTENRAAERRLRRVLARLERRLKGDAFEFSRKKKQTPSPTSDIHFEVLRVPRIPAERCLFEIVRSSDSDLKDVSAPIVVPVFGRGRALAAFYGKGINAFNIEAAVDALMSDWSELADAPDSGFDIPTPADWDAVFGPPRTGRGGDAPLVSIASVLKLNAESRATTSETKVITRRGSLMDHPAKSHGKSVPRGRVLAAALTLTAAALLILFAAIAARRLQKTSAPLQR